jgi:hypothetical protein
VLIQFAESQRQIISEEVVRAFSALPEVAEIYSHVRDARLIYWVFTDEPTYDDALMNRLLDRDLAISKQYSETSMWFEFGALAIYGQASDVVPMDAVRIYQRPDARLS